MRIFGKKLGGLEVLLIGGAVFAFGAYWVSQSKTKLNSSGRPANLGDGVRKGQRFVANNDTFVALGDPAPDVLGAGFTFINARHEATGAAVNVDTRFVTRIL